MMVKLMTLMVFLPLFLSVSGAYFNCLRDGMECQEGECDWDTGECFCDEDFEGPDCGLNSTLKVDDCDMCENNGTCFQNGTTGDNSTLCYCADGFHGDSCEMERTEVECTGENMTITVAPYPGFQGTVFIKNLEDDSQCKLDTDVQNGTVVFTNIFSLREGCEAIVQEDTPEKGATTFMRNLVIRYNPHVVSGLDHYISAVCEHSSSNTSGVDSDKLNVDLEPTMEEAEMAEGSYKPVELEVQDMKGNLIKDDISVSQPLRLYIYLTDTAKYKKINVETCIVHNGKEDEDHKSLKFIENSCRTKQAASVVKGAITSEEEQTAVIVNLVGFKFVDSETIEFECKVRHCEDGDDRCEPKPCGRRQSLTGLGRRKRDTEWDMGDVVVKESITVRDQVDIKTATETQDPVSCIQRKDVFTSVIILGIAVVILLVVCLALSAKALRSRSKCSMVENGVSKVG